MHAVAAGTMTSRSLGGQHPRDPLEVIVAGTRACSGVPMEVVGSVATYAIVFLCASSTSSSLNDSEAEMIDETGRPCPVNYRSDGETLYEQGRSSFLGLVSSRTHQQAGARRGVLG